MANEQENTQPGYKRKAMSAGARNLLHQHNWTGNVREIANTIVRVYLQTNDELITADDIERSLLDMPIDNEKGDHILNRSIENGIDLQGIIGVVAQHYLERAMEFAGGNKKAAVGIIGFKNYQTPTNWLKKYNLVT